MTKNKKGHQPKNKRSVGRPPVKGPRATIDYLRANPAMMYATMVDISDQSGISLPLVKNHIYEAIHNGTIRRVHYLEFTDNKK